MSEAQRATLIELDAKTCEYLATIIACDVRAWDEEPDTPVSREHALALCMFLSDQLAGSARRRVDIPSLDAAPAFA